MPEPPTALPVAGGALYVSGAAGCEAVVTETGKPRDGEPGASYRNIVRAGFEAQYVRANYLSSPEADTSGAA